MSFMIHTMNMNIDLKRWLNEEDEFQALKIPQDNM